jgi:hypothetical protein
MIGNAIFRERSAGGPVVPSSTLTVSSGASRALPVHILHANQLIHKGFGMKRVWYLLVIRAVLIRNKIKRTLWKAFT